MDKENYFGWQPSISAPKEYPAETVHVRFTAADSTGGGMMSLTAQQGWGTGTGEAGVHIQPLPIRLDLCWLSYTENQFWKGSFILPYDKMLALFKHRWTEISGYGDTYTETFSVIMMGMAPGGIVVVWLGGSNGHQIEVARFQAQKGTDDMKDINELVENGGGMTDQDWLKKTRRKRGYI